MSTTLPASPIPSLQTLELRSAQAPLLQRFFDDNPAYFLATSGEAAGPNEAIEEMGRWLRSKLGLAALAAA